MHMHHKICAGFFEESTLLELPVALHQLRCTFFHVPLEKKAFLVSLESTDCTGQAEQV